MFNTNDTIKNGDIQGSEHNQWIMDLSHMEFEKSWHRKTDCKEIHKSKTTKDGAVAS